MRAFSTIARQVAQYFRFNKRKAVNLIASLVIVDYKMKYACAFLLLIALDSRKYKKYEASRENLLKHIQRMRLLSKRGNNCLLFTAFFKYNRAERFEKTKKSRLKNNLIFLLRHSRILGRKCKVGVQLPLSELFKKLFQCH